MWGKILIIVVVAVLEEVIEIIKEENKK